jgi:hypothetical protein
MTALTWIAALPLVAALATSALATGRERPVVLAQKAPEVCSDIYQLVCGTDPGGKRVTYSNACFARAAKATKVTPGECSK